MKATNTLRQLSVVGRTTSGEPRTYRLAPPAPRAVAYRRLATAILGLDISTLTVELRHARHAVQPASSGGLISNVTVRVSPELRTEMVEFATSEQRSLGNMGAMLLEWAFEHLKTAGSTERLFKYREKYGKQKK